MLQAAKYLIYDYFYFLLFLFFYPHAIRPIALGAWCNDGQILNSQDSTIKILKLWLAVCLKEINSIAVVFSKVEWNENPNHEWRIRRVHHLGQCGDEIGIYIYIFKFCLASYIVIWCLKDDNHPFTISLALVNSPDYNRSSNSLMDKSTIMQRRGARHHQLEGRVVLQYMYW